MMKKFKIGDKVIDIMFQEYGIISNINKREKNGYPIEVTFFNNQYPKQWYKERGTLGMYEKQRRLFHNSENIMIKIQSKIVIDTKLIVWNDELSKDKFNRYFKKFQNDGKVICFNNGSTSFSNDGNEQVWNYWKIYDKEEMK